MPLNHDTAGALIADVTRRMDALRAATYEGRDGGGLAVATVDGDGLVVEVRLARTIARHSPVEVTEAIRSAIAAAQQRVAQEFTNLAGEAEEWETQT